MGHKQETNGFDRSGGNDEMPGRKDLLSAAIGPYTDTRYDVAALTANLDGVCMIQHNDIRIFIQARAEKATEIALAPGQRF